MARDEDVLNKNFPEGEEARARGMRILSMFAVAVVVIFVAAVGYIYISNNKTVDPNNLPLITENNPPEKMRPADPGGMEIPHQDASVYDHLNPKQEANQPEKLLPTAEVPVAPGAAATNMPQLDVKNSAPGATQTNVPEQLSGLPAASPATSAPGSQQAPTTIQASQTPAIQTQPAAPLQSAAAAKENPSTPPLALATSSYRIQLGAVRDEASAQKEWARMETKHGDQLKGLNSSFAPVSLGDKGNFLRIQAGPLTKEEAEAHCAKLKLENQACMVVKASQ